MTTPAYFTLVLRAVLDYDQQSYLISIYTVSNYRATYFNQDLVIFRPLSPPPPPPPSSFYWR
jgi:hypothetical protein